VSGQTLTWTKVAYVTRYVLRRRVLGQYESSRLVTGTSITPQAIPGHTVAYRVRTAVLGSPWSAERSVTYPPSSPVTGPLPEEGVTPTGPGSEPSVETPPAPLLSVHGNTISWAPIPGATSYTLATVLNPTTSRDTTYQLTTGTSVTPPPVPGATVSYGLAVRTPVGGPWAKEVSVTYPPAEGETPPTPPPALSHKIIGTNDAAGWGPTFAHTLLAGHITWNRVEIGSPNNPISLSQQYGFRSIAIVGNTPDGTPLSSYSPTQWAQTVVTQLAEHPEIALAEAGNEMYYKHGTADPVQYGRMYLAAVNAVKAAGIHTPLLFNMFGDYAVTSPNGSTSWSQDAHNGGWLRDAVNGVPGLASAISANGLSTHPYGAVGEDQADDAGVKSVAGQEAVARTVLGTTPPFYITEFGYDLAACGAPRGACSLQEQASKMQAAYNVFLADPSVAGIWWYQAHDDSTGQFGFINEGNTTRPAFGVISAFAVEQGQ
jgi:hypothetical protein